MQGDTPRAEHALRGGLKGATRSLWEPASGRVERRRRRARRGFQAVGHYHSDRTHRSRSRAHATETVIDSTPTGASTNTISGETIDSTLSRTVIASREDTNHVRLQFQRARVSRARARLFCGAVLLPCCVVRRQAGSSLRALACRCGAVAGRLLCGAGAEKNDRNYTGQRSFGQCQSTITPSSGHHARPSSVGVRSTSTVSEPQLGQLFRAISARKSAIGVNPCDVGANSAPRAEANRRSP